MLCNIIFKLSQVKVLITFINIKSNIIKCVGYYKCLSGVDAYTFRLGMYANVCAFIRMCVCVCVCVRARARVYVCVCECMCVCE